MYTFQECLVSNHPNPNLPSSTLSLGCLGCLADRTGEPRLKLSFLRTCSALISASALSRTTAASRDDSTNGDVALGPRVVAVVAGGTDAGTSSELVDLAAASASLVFPASTEVVEVSGLRVLGVNSIEKLKSQLSCQFNCAIELSFPRIEILLK